MTFDSEPIIDELRHLLIGKYFRPPQRRGTRNRTQFTTAFECPKTNEAFCALSGVGPEWTVDDTWVQVRRALEAPRHSSPAALAARYLLYLAPIWGKRTAAEERMQRQKLAAEALGLSWTADKFQFRDDGRATRFASDIVDAAVHGLQGALVAAATSAPARASAAAQQGGSGKRSQVSAWGSEAGAELVRRLERLPAHYPAHLTTSILAPLLDPHIRVPQEDPKPDEVPSLPPLWRDESEDVSELLRAAGARAYIIGEPGTGKSTLLRSMALTQMSELPGAAGIAIPLIDLAERLPEHSLPLTEMLALIIDVNCQYTGPLVPETTDRLVQLLEADDSTVVCLDGLDEVPEGALADRTLRAIETLGRIPGSVIVSARIGPRIRVPAGWDTIVMRPVRTMKRLLDLWFIDPDDPRKEHALEILKSRVVADVSGSPLLLGFVAYAASFDRDFDSLPDLYEQYIALTLERIWKAAGQREPDDVMIENLTHIARVLAWRMAYGQDEADTPGAEGWREGETLTAILRMFDRADREDVARIVQSEGLFTLGLAAASRLHSSYRWVHRTVQEHLVAMHLQEREGKDAAALVERLLGLLSSGDDWRVVTQHLFARLTPHYQVELLRRLDAAVDDPRYITGEPEALFENLAQMLQEGSEVIDFLIERARAQGSWPVRFYTEPEQARADLLTAAVGTVAIDVIGADTPGSREAIDADYLHQLIPLLLRHPRLHFGPLLECCLALESRVPGEGVRAFFDVIEAGPGLQTHPWPDDILEKLDLATIIQEVSERTDRSVRWRLVHFLFACLRVDPKIAVAPAGPLDPIDFNIFQLVQSKIIGNAYSLGQTQRQAIAGDYGDVLAYIAAKGLAADAVRGIVEHPWAVVGAWEYLLLHGGDATGTALILEEPLTANEVMFAYHSDWRADPYRMRLLYRAIGEVVFNPDTVSTVALTELYRKVICDPDRTEFTYATAYVANQTLENVLNAVLRLRGSVDIAAEVLNGDPAEWVGSAGRIPVLERYLVDSDRVDKTGWNDDDYERHWAAMSQLFYETTTWGARARMALMPLFADHFMEAPSTRGRSLAALDREVLEIPGNLAWLDRTMMLFRPYFWRENRRTYLKPLLDVPRAQPRRQDAGKVPTISMNEVPS